ncbi:MAG: translational machinery protein [Reyranella sp.]|nr:translational machinery protein [Reyranella sp.]
MAHTPTNAVVWLDHREAKIFLVTPEDLEKQRIKAGTPHRQVHHKANELGSGHVRDDRKFFEAILAELENADHWLMVGPGETKKELDKYLDQHAEELKRKLLGVETSDHPTDGELLAHARKLFKAQVTT